MVTISSLQSLVGVMPDRGLEPPHIGTPLERLELVGPEVPWHDLLGEPVLVEDDERLPVRCPTDDIVEPFIFRVLKDFV